MVLIGRHVHYASRMLSTLAANWSCVLCEEGLGRARVVSQKLMGLLGTDGYTQFPRRAPMGTVSIDTILNLTQPYKIPSLQGSFKGECPGICGE